MQFLQDLLLAQVFPCFSRKFVLLRFLVFQCPPSVEPVSIVFAQFCIQASFVCPPVSIMFGTAAVLLLRRLGPESAGKKQTSLPAKYEKSSGVGQSIIGMLEVCESGFAESMAQGRD